MLRKKQSPANSIRFGLRVRSRQLRSVSAGIQKSQRLFFGSSKALWKNWKILFQVPMRRTAFLSPFYLVNLRAQIDLLESIHSFKRVGGQATDRGDKYLEKTYLINNCYPKYMKNSSNSMRK